MSLNARKQSAPKTNSEFGDTPPLESGTYPCRLVQVIGLGEQPQRAFKGEDKPPAQEIMLTYEFTDEFMLDKEGNVVEDKPRWLSETLPLRSLESDLANSTKRYYALDPDEEKEGDFAALVNTPCMVTVVQNQGKDKKGNAKIYENISNVSAMRSKQAESLPELVNPPKVFDSQEPDMEVFGSLPDWIQEKIKKALDHNAAAYTTSGGKTSSSETEENDEEENW